MPRQPLAKLRQDAKGLPVQRSCRQFLSLSLNSEASIARTKRISVIIAVDAIQIWSEVNQMDFSVRATLWLSRVVP